MTEDKIDRTKLTFEQAEGVAALPQQMKLRVVSDELRAQLWHYIHDAVSASLNRDSFGYAHVGGIWERILRTMHVEHYHQMIDDFDTDWDEQLTKLKSIFKRGTYTEIFGFLQWIMRHKSAPSNSFASDIDARLERCRSAYRVVNGNTIAPVSSTEELQVLQRAFSDLGSTEFNGARQHLKLAAERASSGEWADCIRESINAVEATVRCIDPEAKDIGPALAELKKRGTVHGSLKQGLQNLYGYASDQKGVRHSLVFEDTANVDQTDALFMLGACASFVSYLINKGRAAGLIKQ